MNMSNAQDNQAYKQVPARLSIVAVRRILLSRRALDIFGYVSTPCDRQLCVPYTILPSCVCASSSTAGCLGP